MTTPFDLRCPVPSDVGDRQPPPPIELLGEWYIIYTSLPIWHDKRNIQVTYSSASPAEFNASCFEDSVAYQTLSSPKVKTIQGTNTACYQRPGSWNWRGKGLARIAGHRWDLLGYGNLEGAGQWMVTFSDKSLFTSTAMTFLARRSDILTEELREKLDLALRKLNQTDLEGLAEKMSKTNRD